MADGGLFGIDLRFIGDPTAVAASSNVHAGTPDDGLSGT
jgi:hypothetical protein